MADGSGAHAEFVQEIYGGSGKVTYLRRLLFAANAFEFIDEHYRLWKMKSLALERILLLCLIAISAGLVLLSSFPATNLPSRDGGIYAYVGSEIVRGELPYVDAWESKPPGIFYLNALALYLGGRWFIWLFEFFFLCAAAWIGHSVMEIWWGKFPALIGTLSWLSGLIFLMLDGNYTEEYSLPFSFLAFFLFSLSLERKATLTSDFLIGLTGGLSFVLRANNIGVQAAIAFTLLAFGLWQKEYLRTFTRLSLIGIGMALPFVLFVFYFARRGALQPMLDAALIYNFSYTGEHGNLLFTLGRGFLVLNLIALIALVGYLTILFYERKKIKTGSAMQWYFLLLIAWPVEMLLSSLSGRAYNHYYICWLPVLGLLCAFAFSYHGKRVDQVLSSRSIGLTYLFLIVVLLIGSTSALKTYSETFISWISGGKLPEQVDPVSMYVREHTAPDEQVLVWGAQAGINFLSEREAPTPYFLYPLFIPSPVTVPMADQFLADLKKNPPVLIVDAYSSAVGYEVFYSLDPKIRLQQQMNVQPDNLVFTAHNIEDVFDLIERHYRYETTIGAIQIYRLPP
jgi:hypothetical protein